MKLVAVVAILVCTGCNARPASDAGAERAKALFAQQCALCHGTTGMGDGIAAGHLPAKPRNFTDAGWQAQVTDVQMKEIIVRGGQAVGKSPVMPGQPALASEPDVLDALVRIIRSFKP